MDELIKLHNAITQLVNNWDSLIKQFLLEFEPYFIDIVQEQLSIGKGGDGKDLDTYASIKYAEFKSAIGSISSPIADLKLSGDFYEEMTMNDNFEIFSTDWKNELLHRDFGDDITEVQTNNLNELIRDQILPELQDFIKTKLGL